MSGSGMVGLAAGQDYPRTYREFVTAFPDETACTRYLEELRWPDGFVCPACGAIGEPWRQTRGRLTCRWCRRQATVMAGTILDKTRTHRLPGVIRLGRRIVVSRTMLGDFLRGKGEGEGQPD